MITLQQALDSYSQHLQPLPAQTLPLDEAVGRVLSVSVHSGIDLPRFDQSAMDGYAMHTRDAAADLPVVSVAACGDAAPALRPGTACRIFTGAAIPRGADTVIPQERVAREGDHITLQTTPDPGANIRRAGEELQHGDELISAGQRLTSGAAASLAMAGVARVSAAPSPRIAVLITGDEVVAPGQALGQHQIPDANGPLIRFTLANWGYTNVGIAYVGDQQSAVRAALDDALANADLVITTGGASVGDRDFLPAVTTALGMRRVFWKVAQKPGKPLLFATRERTGLLALPGNPAAVWVGLMLHLRTALNCLEGVGNPLPAWCCGCVQQDYGADKRERLLRMRASTDAHGRVCLAALPKQASHMLSNLAQTNAIVRLPAEQPLQRGDTVPWLPIM